MKKTNFFRRALSWLLVLALVAGYLIPAGAATSGSELRLGIEQIGNDAVSAGLPMAQTERADTSEPDMNEIVRVSIELQKAPTMDAGFALEGIAADAGAMAYRDSLKQEQENVIAAIERTVLNGRELDVVWNLTLAANVISANVPRGAISRIEKLAGVSRVVEERRYEPQVASVGGTYEPNMAISGQMTGSQQSWLSGYTGAGKLIAVIDTGLDTDHQAFGAEAFAYALEEAASVTGKTYELLEPADIEKVLTKLNAYTRQADSGVTLTAEELYINAKAAFGYNYIDGNLDVTHDNDTMGSHGSHVAGIAAANRFVSIDGGFVDAIAGHARCPDFDHEGLWRRGRCL